MMPDTILRHAGIPPRLRGRVWPFLIGNAMRISPEIFDICVGRARKLRAWHSLQVPVCLQLPWARPEPAASCVWSDSGHSLLSRGRVQRASGSRVSAGRLWLASVPALSCVPRRAALCADTPPPPLLRPTLSPSRLMASQSSHAAVNGEFSSGNVVALEARRRREDSVDSLPDLITINTAKLGRENTLSVRSRATCVCPAGATGTLMSLLCLWGPRTRRPAWSAGVPHCRVQPSSHAVLSACPACS
jgi:hypothetical protein